MLLTACFYEVTACFCEATACFYEVKTKSYEILTACFCEAKGVRGWYLILITIPLLQQEGIGELGDPLGMIAKRGWGVYRKKKEKHKIYYSYYYPARWPSIRGKIKINLLNHT